MHTHAHTCTCTCVPGGEEVGGDGGGAGLGAEGGELPHLGAGDRDEVVRAALVLVAHRVVLLVVVDLLVVCGGMSIQYILP